MSRLDDIGDEPTSAAAAPPSVAEVASRWPLLAVIGGSIIAGLMAATRSAVISTYAYGALLLGGCGLLFYRRVDAIATTRSAGGAGVLVVQTVEKAAIACLSLACLANGIVIAFEVARWSVWERVL